MPFGECHEAAVTNGLPEVPTTAPTQGRPRGWIVVAVLTLFVAAVAAYAKVERAQPHPSEDAPAATGTPLDDATARAPQGLRVVVRVVNASGVRGLGRRATLLLRDFGYDVVDYDTDRNGEVAATDIIVHTGHEEWGRRVARALGTGTVSSRADTSRYVDLTVRLGRDWQPPPEPLRP
jgi:hypothetical protein